MEDNNFWYEVQPVPDDVKQQLRLAVKGNKILNLYPDEPEPLWLLKVDWSTFKTAFTMNRKYLYKGNFTAPPDENDYDDSDCYLTEDGLAGFAVTANHWLVSMYSNLERRGFIKKISSIATQKATKLVCIISGGIEDDKLVDIYCNVLGFRPFVRTHNDTEIMKKYYGDAFIDDFVLHYGAPFHLFMIRADRDAGVGGLRVFEDYFEAEAFVDHEVE